MPLAKEIVAKVKASTVLVLCELAVEMRVPQPGSDNIPTNELQTIRTKIGKFGSGFVVAPEGYIVTNGHVLYSMCDCDLRHDDDVRKDFVEKVSAELRLPIEYIDAYARITKGPDRMIMVQFGKAIPSLNASGAGVLTARTVGDPSPSIEKDMAMIKVDKKNLQTLELADSTKIETTDEVWICGYPGVVLENIFIDSTDGIEPSITSGTVSGIRPTMDGSSVIETNADITQGNSGGPAVNDKGEVIGIATFGSTSGQHEVSGYNFLRPSELIEEFAMERGVQNRKNSRILEEVVKKLQTLLNASYSHGKFKREHCVHFHTGFCTRWAWTRAPQKFIANGTALRFIETLDKTGYHMEAHEIYCAICPSFTEKEKIDRPIPREWEEK